MKRRALLTLILFAINNVAHGVDIVYIVAQDSQLRDPGHLLRMIGSVREGDIVFFQGRITTNLDAVEFLVRNEQGQEGWINSRHIMLRDSQPLPVFVTNKFWIPSYYQRFLAGAEKEDLFDHEPFWRDEYDALTRHEGPHQLPWWASAGKTRFNIQDNFVWITGIPAGDNISFATIAQRHDAGTVTLYVLCEHKRNFVQHSQLNSRFSVGETYRLTLRIDGDYMDVFVDDDAEAIVTLVGVDERTARAVDNFFNSGTMPDPSHIIWPRRADGGMDFSPPDGVTFWADHAAPSEPEATAEQPESASEAQHRENGMPSWVLVVVIGVVIVVVGGFVLVVVKRRKA